MQALPNGLYTGAISQPRKYILSLGESISGEYGLLYPNYHPLIQHNYEEADSQIYSLGSGHHCGEMAKGEVGLSTPYNIMLSTPR